MLLASIADKSNDRNIFKRSWKYKKLTDTTIGNCDYCITFQNQKFHQEINHPFKITIPVNGSERRFQEVYSNSSFQSYIPTCTFFAYSGNRYFDDISVIPMEEINSHPLMDALDFNKSVEPKTLIQWIANIKTKELFAKDRKDDIKADNFRNAISNIENIISEIISQKVEFSFDYDPFEVHTIIDNQALSFDTLPDGLKSIISWIGNLLMRMDRLEWDNDLTIFEQNFVLFLDEIEVHLHPAWQRKILPVVQKLFKNAQIFISTHSPFVVGSVDGAWIHKFKKDGAYAVLDGEPELSEDGKSVRRILDEIFGIDEQYGVDVEKDLETFREYRQQIMMGQEYNVEKFNKLVKHLASQSTELEHSMGMEMNQLRRITQKELV